MNPDEELEWEAEMFVDQSREWMRRCPESKRCPCSKIFNYLLALRDKIARQEHEIKRQLEFPNEK